MNAIVIEGAIWIHIANLDDEYSREALSVLDRGEIGIKRRVDGDGIEQIFVRREDAVEARQLFGTELISLRAMGVRK